MRVADDSKKIEVLALSVADAAAAVSLSIDSIQKAIKNNDLAVKYYGAKPLVPVDALKAWFDSLDDEKPGRVAS